MPKIYNIITQIQRITSIFVVYCNKLYMKHNYDAYVLLFSENGTSSSGRGATSPLVLTPRGSFTLAGSPDPGRKSPACDIIAELKAVNGAASLKKSKRRDSNGSSKYFGASNVNGDSRDVTPVGSPAKVGYVGV